MRKLDGQKTLNNVLPYQSNSKKLNWSHYQKLKSLTIPSVDYWAKWELSYTAGSV